MKIRPLLALIALFLPSLSATTRADDSANQDESVRYVKGYYEETVAEDGTEDTKTTLAIKVLKQDAVDDMKQYALTYSTSAEKVEVLEAYTEKPDGKHVDAPKSNFQLDVNGGREGGPPAFSDQTTLTIVFPDVAVGDTINLVYRRQVTDPLFPKQFSNLHGYSYTVLYDDARIKYSVPKSLNVRYKNFGMTETMNKEENGRQVMEWTFKNTTVKKEKFTESPVTEIGDDPGLLISTFPSYQSIAESYGARAKPKAAVTDEIRKLADEITKGKTEPREIAKALYDWEIDHMTYAGNCIGIGAVVPRDLDFVLKNKMGDCKDHATLLQALLNAKGIDNTQALIGVNDIYTLPDPPLIDIINHVINYIPSMDLYLDATSGMPFGTLPSSLSAKPVLLVDGYKDGTKTPKRPQGQSRVKVTAKVTISEDGSADGVTTIATIAPEGGSHAAQLRMKNITPKKLEEAGEYAIKNSGYQGHVTLDPATWDGTTMTFTNNIHFHLKDFVHPGTPGAISAEPPFSPQPIGSAISHAARALTQEKTDPLKHGFLCLDGVMEEAYEYTLPKNLTILALPNDLTVESKVQSYTAHYKQDGQVLTVTRTLNDTSPGPVCPADVDGEYRTLAAKAWPDLKGQIVYK